METYLDWILNTDVAEYWDSKNDKKRKLVITPVYCNDGTHLSIQASDGHYCHPRTNYAGWYEVEVGFPTATPSNEWAKYFDGEWYENKWKRFIKKDFGSFIYTIKNIPSFKKYCKTNKEFIDIIFLQIKRSLEFLKNPIGCDSVYGYVPVELVKEYIESHGGEDTGKCWIEYNSKILNL